MLEKVSLWLVHNVLISKVKDQNSIDIYIYGMSLFLSTFIGIISVIIISAIFSEIYIGVIFLIVYIPLRAYAGGYHCDTYLRCYIVTNIIFALNMIVIELLKKLPREFSFYLALVATVLSFVYIVLNAPVINESNRLTERRKQKNRKKAIVLAGIVSMANVLFIALSDNTLFRCISCIVAFAETTVSALMYIQKIKERRKKHA